MQKDIKTFEESIHVHFNDTSLIRQAFTHRSYLNEHRNEAGGHNERLEFLGDAVLELVVTRYLYQKFPHQNEGDLTAYRSALVNAVTLGDLASDLFVVRGGASRVYSDLDHQWELFPIAAGSGSGTVASS